MTDEQIAEARGSATGELTCKLCGVALDPESVLTVSGHTACAKCVQQLETEVAETQAGVGSVPLALAGTLAGALLGAAVWAAIAIATDYEIGYVAVLVGFLAGKGATLATGGAHGRSLQQVAVVGALFGLVAAKYVIFAHAGKQYFAEELGEVIGYLDGRIASAFVESLREMTGLFDLLWIFIAVTAAWRVPASPTLNVARK
jgi:hypothetical protein